MKIIWEIVCLEHQIKGNNNFVLFIFYHESLQTYISFSRDGALIAVTYQGVMQKFLLRLEIFFFDYGF